MRSPERVGLIRARLLGAAKSTAEVLTFLDSHIECTEGWLEPLLDRIARNYRTVASPVIETIDEKTFQYKFVTADLMGTFNWKLEFDWTQISEEQLAAREHKWAPYKSVKYSDNLTNIKNSYFPSSPTMAGGLFSISKFWFEQIGLYDEGEIVRLCKIV